MAWVLLGQKPSIIKIIGVALGMLGMYVLVSQENIKTSPDAYKGLIAIAISIFGWSLGALYVKGANVPTSKVLNTAIQMLSAAVILMLVSLIAREDVGGIAVKFTWSAFASVLYLIFFGSIIAYSAFNYLLMQEDPRKVVTVTYVNPIIAVFWAGC
jgi:drug/metabolite transporter (DMT)-like permease